MPVRSTRRAAAGMVATTLVLAACAGSGDPRAVAAGSGALQSGLARIDRPLTTYHGTLLDPPTRRPSLTLRDTSGRAFALADRPRGEITVVFFGYTHCPDLCPTTMADLAAARRMLPRPIREQVTVVFVTEDPRRDTGKVLRGWLDRFDADFVGLRGGNERTQRVLQELYLPESKRIAAPTPAVVHPQDSHRHPGEYGVEHAGIVYAFGPGGTVIYTGGTTSAQFAEDFTRLAESE